MYSIQYNSVMNEFCVCYYGECSEMAMLQVPDWFQELSFYVQTLTHMLNDGLTTLTFHSLQTCHLIIVKDQVFPSTNPACAFTCVVCEVYSGVLVRMLLFLSPDYIFLLCCS